MALKLEIRGPIPPSIFIDATPALLYRSLSVQMNTVDFALIDPATNATAAVLAVGNAVQIVALGWSGTIASVESRDPVDIRNGHVIYAISATNTVSPLVAAGGASISLSDQPTTVTDTILLEDGSGGISLESGSLTEPGLIEMEGALPGYQQLSVRTQATGSLTPTGVGFVSIYPTISTLGKLTTFQGGLWPGIQFALYSNNQGIAGTLYTVTEMQITWPAGQPVYRISFGLPASVTAQDPPWTLLNWTKAVAHG